MRVVCPTDSCTTTADPLYSIDKPYAILSGVAGSYLVDKTNSGTDLSLPKGPVKVNFGLNGQ